MFKRVRDILKILQDEYDQINSYYEHLGNKVEKGKVKLILDHVMQNLSTFKKMISGYGSEEKKSLLDTWIQFSPDASLKLQMADIEIHPDMSVEEVINIVVDIDDWLENYFRFMSEKTSSLKLKEVFSRLSETVNKEKLELVSSSNLLKDM
jgi:hypothetical protein